MPTLFSTQTVSEAWCEATAFLLNQDRNRVHHLMMAIERPADETPGVRQQVDRLNPSSGISSVIERVADTLFPQDLYDPAEDGAVNNLFERRLLAREFEVETVPNGNYFDRMCAYPQDGQPFNQIAHVLDRLNASRRSRKSNANRTQIGLSMAGEEIRLQAPGTDKDIMGFPCLSHISVTLSGGKVHLAATYRAQRFVEKAYGNLLGLGRLANFLAIESQFGVGEVLCIATGAVLGDSPAGMSVVRDVVNNTQQLIKRSNEIERD